MKRIILTLTILLSFAVSANADLQNLGTDSLGNRLIYDTDLDITWYDYSNVRTWQNMVNWAERLSVDFGGTIFDDWRLPTISPSDSSCSFYEFVGGYPRQNYGYNCINSEMGHLFYTELGNEGQYDTAGNSTGCGGGAGEPFCLTNTGDFQNLQFGYYWSGTEYAPNTLNAWYFGTWGGYQSDGGGQRDGMAVRSGMAVLGETVVPEPISSILFIAGGVVLAGRRYLRKQ